MFERSGPPKSERDCGNLHILPIGSISVKCTVPIRHGRNIGSLGANPTWTHLAQLGSKMAQLGSNLMGDIAGPIRNPQNAIFTSKAFFSINDASFEAMFPMLCLCWARSWSPKGPKLRHFWTWLRLPCGSHAQCDTLLALMGVHARPCCPHCAYWAQLRPQMPHTQDQVAHAKPNGPKLRHVRSQSGSSWAQVGTTGPSSAPVTPKLGPSEFVFSPT